ncbi:MAG: Heme-degrading monooxygenase HmoA [Mycobacterium sp.]|jgi:heme-degrading monooxygenase HmoA|nr:Heme-degrading monooxygenase HmoA [Mycobacterium sp.]
MSDPFRVMLAMEVAPELETEFERAWREGTAVIASHPANLAHWLSKSTGQDHLYYIVSDWTDEESFRAFERSDAHLAHRAKLHPYRSGGSFHTMRVLARIDATNAATEPVG